MTAMAVVHSSIFRVIRRFPERREDILRLFYECEGFRNTCEDYRKCIDAIEYWDNQASEQSFARQTEYEELFRSLEAELLTYLKNCQLRRNT